MLYSKTFSRIFFTCMHCIFKELSWRKVGSHAHHQLKSKHTHKQGTRRQSNYILQPRGCLRTEQGRPRERLSLQSKRARTKARVLPSGMDCGHLFWIFHSEQHTFGQYCFCDAYSSASIIRVSLWFPLPFVSSQCQENK